MKSLSAFLSTCVLLMAVHTRADQIVETFETRSRLETATDFAATAIWNQTLGQLHPSLRLVGYKPSATPRDFEIGDGSDGEFDVSTYSQFSQNGDISGNKIRLTSSTLNVTRFNLAQGWILEPVGTSALIIKSQSDVIILGQIWCHGDDGTAAAGATPGTGGQGRCGGARGGDGGSVGGHGSAGDSLGSVTGGAGGKFTGGAVVGGGGGGARNCNGDTTCTTVTAGDGSNASVANGGTHGTSVDDPEFLTTGGGAGGGGGAGTATAAGGGGGGGGGSVHIFAGRNVALGASPSSTYGFIYASGGKGGNSNVGGGPGGGGGGGSVLVFAGGNINIYNNDGSGASQANAGGHGTNSGVQTGGDGLSGRSWFTSISYSGPGFYTPAEETPIITGNKVQYNSTRQSAVTRVIDLQSSLATIDAIAFSPTSSDFAIEYRGSSDAFTSDDTGWVESANSISGKRYVRLRISITSSSTTSPSRLDSLTLTYTPHRQEEFAFKAAGCGRISNPSANSNHGGFFLWALALLLWLRARIRSQAR